MTRTEVVRLLVGRTEKEVLRALGDRVGALWNAANYVCRQNFFKGEKIPSYSKLCSLMKDSEEYKILPSDVAQETLKKLRKAWTSFFKLKGLYEAGKLEHRPSPPRYRKDRATGKRPCDWIPVKNPRSYAFDRDWFHLTLPQDLRKTYGGRLAVPYEGRFRWRGRRTTCEIKYDPARNRWYVHAQKEVKLGNRNGDKTAAIDLGAKRAATLVIKEVPIGFVFSARNPWKDYKYWTRKIAEVQSLLASQGLKTSRRLKKLYRIRTARLDHALRTMTRAVAKICLPTA